MEWTEESITCLRGFWQEGLSTAEIGRRMQITKNAVVGKAHRLTLPPRPSPIRKNLELASTGLQPQRSVLANATSSPPPPRPAPVRVPVVVAELREPENAAPATVPVPAPDADTVNVHPLRPVVAAPEIAVAPRAVAVSVAAQPKAQADEVVVPVLRAVPAPPRRHGLTCCWPLGDPGTKGFTFCGGDPIAGKPYCAQHAALAYVKIRDRRENVA